MNPKAMPKCWLLLGCVTLFLMALDGLILVPFGAAIATQAGVGAGSAGYLTGAYALAAALSSLLLARFRVWDGNNQALVLASLLGLGVSTLLFTAVQAFPALLALRALAGFSAGVLAVANLRYQLLVGQGAEIKQRSAKLLSMYPLALTLGVPGLLWLSGTQNWRLGLQLLGGLCLVFCLAWAWAPRPQGTQPGQAGAPALDSRGRRRLAVAALLVFVTVLATFVMSTQLPVMLVQRLHSSDSLLQLSYLAGGAGTVLLMQAYGRYAQRLAFLPLMLALSLLMVASSALALFSLSSALAAAMFVLFMMASATRTLVVVSEVLAGADGAERPRLVALQNALQHGAVGVGGSLGSLALNHGLPGQLAYHQLLALGAVLTLLGPVCVWLWHRARGALATVAGPA